MLIIGLQGSSLSDAEREWLRAPQVSGVILFTRNFVHRQQLQELVTQLRSARGDGLLICIDQEGGPVCRIRGEEFVPLPALAHLGDLYDRDPAAAVSLTEQHAWLMASEMRALGIDLSFAPVVDLRLGNRVIGERALHADPEIVGDLAQAYIRGMHLAGMAATAKHFPGHGSVLEDTHIEDAVDSRSLAELRSADLRPFAASIEAGVEAVMMAHVRYPEVDLHPAGYSKIWIKDVLRDEMRFKGIIFSDDIAMAAAAPAGAIGARIHAHLDAGCDLVLVCKPNWAAAAIAATQDCKPCDPQRLLPLVGAVAPSWDALVDNPQRSAQMANLATLDAVGGST